LIIVPLKFEETEDAGDEAVLFSGELFEFAGVEEDAAAIRAFFDGDALEEDRMHLKTALGAVIEMKLFEVLELGGVHVLADLFGQGLASFDFLSGKVFLFFVRGLDGR